MNDHPRIDPAAVVELATTCPACGVVDLGKIPVSMLEKCQLEIIATLCHRCGHICILTANGLREPSDSELVAHLKSLEWPLQQRYQRAIRFRDRLSWFEEGAAP